MDHRPALPSTQRPLPPQRALSGSYALQQGLRRAPVPSRLNNVRSFSQPANIVDLTSESAISADLANAAAFLTNQEHVTVSPEALYLSGDDNNDDDEDYGRPAKRARTNGPDFRPSSQSSDGETDAAHQPVPGSPLPHMRKQMGPPSRTTVKPTSRKPVDRAARRAHGLEPPSIATRLPPPRGVADFLPWNGNHSEDVMNETVIKAGYYDKAAGPNSTECNSAKPTIWPNLSQKNNMGLQTLSYLFSQVMEKRQQMGKCTAPSTFKPPPRVTVTDTKREAWLRDLANPDVPLRKQSRTIPHGIRGKQLMEHCLIKEIPLPRAVWLAKCVGANELRAFRRKGVSGTAAATGELKWIRDWTIQVELFLDSVVADCGKPGWQSRMDYAVKLATSLYTERLVERDHYLNWIVTSLSQAAMDRLPVWIILTQLYWRDITAFGRRGRRLAKAVLETLHQIHLGNYLVNHRLGDRLKKLVVILAVTNRGCLILPKTWTRYRHLLAPQMLCATTAPLEAAIQNLLKRNLRLVKPLSKTAENTKSLLLDLYLTLDAVGVDVDYHSLTASCLGKIPDVRKLIPAIMDWTASVYRTGESRVYLGSKIIVQLYDMGVDTDLVVLEYLRTSHRPSSIAANVHRMIAELARAGCFFPGRYLQWLMTSGLLNSGKNSNIAAGLLAALPLDALPPHLLNTRNTLMRRLGLNRDEDEFLDQLQAQVDSSMGVMTSSTLNVIDTFSGSAKLELGRRLALLAATWAKGGGINLHSYCNLRDCLERCNDLPSLSKVTQAAMYTEDVTLLATIGDTINLHIKGFAAIGCLQMAVDQLLERYRTLRSQALDRTLILTLIALVGRCADKVGVVRFLENNLALCEQQTSMAVYSPASDSLIGMQATSLDSDNDVDAVFLSGNTMDEQLMQRVFNRIVQHASKPGHPGHPDIPIPGKVCGWLNQLRAFDSSCFEQLVTNFAQGFLHSAGDSLGPFKVTSTLIASGSLTFDKLVDLANDAKTPSAAAIVLKMLTSESVANDSFHVVEAYRLQTQQACYTTDFASKVAPLLVKALDYPALVGDHALAHLALEYSVMNTHDGLDKSVAARESASFVANSGRMTMYMLNLSKGQDESGFKLNAKSIIALATPLSVVQCAAALEYFSKTEAIEGSEHAQGLTHAILEAVSNGCEVWPQLLDRSGKDTVRAIYHWAREQVLNNIMPADEVIGTSEEIQRYLNILDVAHHSAGDDDVTSVVAIVADKLKALEARIAALDINPATEREYGILMTSLQILLHLSILFSANSADDTEMLQQNRANLLAALCALLVQPRLQAQNAILEYIHDVASTIADILPSEILATLVKTVSTGIARDPRLASILGTSPSPDAWLALVTHAPLPGTQPQRALLKQPASSRQAPQSPIAQQKAPLRPDGKVAGDTKTVPYSLRRWEIMSDAAPVVGGNDTSLSLTLFAARKV